MKKISILLILCFVVLPICLFADDDLVIIWADGDEDIAWANDNEEIEIPYWADEDIVWDDGSFDDDFPEEERGPFRIKNRRVELGLANLNFGFSNDYISVGEFLQETVVLNIDNFSEGFGLSLGVFLSPLFFNYNSKNDKWGFGFSTGLDVSGNIRLSGNMLTFSEANDDKSDVAVAAFAEMELSAFFPIQKFKVHVKPSLYFPLVYTKSDIYYTHINRRVGGNDETIYLLGFDMRVYSGFPMEIPDEGFRLTATPGVDIKIGAEYPLSEVLNLKDIHRLLDFDVGLDLINLPIVPSAMRDYMELKGWVGSEDPLVILDDDFNIIEFDDLFEIDEEPIYGEERQNVLRPFKMHAWAVWRPLGSQLITVTPTVGFAVNPIFARPVSMEGGLKSRLDLANLFLITFGVGHYDRVWKNSLDFALNFRAFELGLGLNLQSPRFGKSWSGAGIGVDFGLKFGW